MTYTLAMDIGDLIVMGGVLLSIVGSVVGTKAKKAALAKKAGGSPVSTGSTGLKRATPRTHHVPPSQPVKPRRVESTPVRKPLETTESNFPAAPTKRRAMYKWNWRQAIIAQTVLGPPRGMKGWDRA
jgi:hypothetical protein